MKKRIAAVASASVMMLGAAGYLPQNTWTDQILLTSSAEKAKGNVYLKIESQNEEVKLNEKTGFDVYIRSDVELDTLQFSFNVEGGYIGEGNSEFIIDTDSMEKIGFDKWSYTEKVSEEMKLDYPDLEDYLFMGYDYFFDDDEVSDDWIKIGTLMVTPTSDELTVTTSDMRKGKGATGIANYNVSEFVEWVTIPATVKVTDGKSSTNNPVIEYKALNGAAALRWSAVDGADKYAVCGYVNGKWTNIAQGNGTAYTLNGLQAGKQYKVAVLSKVNGVWNKDTSNAINVSAAVNKYPVVTAKVRDKQFRLSWTPVPDAERYGIAVFVAGKWKIQTQNIPASVTSYTSPKLKAGQTYKILIAAKVNGKWDLTSSASRAVNVTVR